MGELRRCSRCVMPETWPGIMFDAEGVCSVCRNYEKKPNIDWGQRRLDLNAILSRYVVRAASKGNKYNCLVGYSGGKDSAYTLWAMVKKYGMKPLAVTWDHGFKMDVDAEYNLMEIPKILDVDHLRFTIGNGLRNGICRKASKVAGDFCYHCHLGVGAFPARVSKMFEIPLQVWGEPTAEYGTFGAYKYEDLEEQNYDHYRKVFAAGTMPEQLVPDGYDFTDMWPMVWPDDDWLHDNLKAIYLGSYEPWDQREHARIIEQELGWKPYSIDHDLITEEKDIRNELIARYGNYVDWDKRDCPYETIRNWQKFIRRGFDKLSFQCSKDIRDGLMTREEALEIIKQEGQRPLNMEAFCEETGISEAEFYRITNRQI